MSDRLRREIVRTAPDQIADPGETMKTGYFLGVFVFSFAILGWVGTEIFRQALHPKEVTHRVAPLSSSRNRSRKAECLASYGRNAGGLYMGPRSMSLTDSGLSSS